MNLIRVGADGRMDIARVSGTLAQVVSGVLLLAAAGLLIVLERRGRSADPGVIDRAGKTVVL